MAMGKIVAPCLALLFSGIVLSIGVILASDIMVLIGLAALIPLLVVFVLFQRQDVLDAAVRDALDASEIVGRWRLVSGGQIVQTSGALIFADALLNTIVRVLPSDWVMAFVYRIIRSTGADHHLQHMPIVFVYCPNERPLAVPWESVRASDAQFAAYLKRRSWQTPSQSTRLTDAC